MMALRVKFRFVPRLALPCPATPSRALPCLPCLALPSPAPPRPPPPRPAPPALPRPPPPFPAPPSPAKPSRAQPRLACLAKTFSSGARPLRLTHVLAGRRPLLHVLPHRPRLLPQRRGPRAQFGELAVTALERLKVFFGASQRRDLQADALDDLAAGTIARRPARLEPQAAYESPLLLAVGLIDDAYNANNSSDLIEPVQVSAALVVPFKRGVHRVFVALPHNIRVNDFRQRLLA